MKRKVYIQRIDGIPVVATNSVGGLKTAVMPEQIVTAIENGAVKIDTHKAYDTKTGFFTVPVSGHYQINTITDIATNSEVQIKRAGDAIWVTWGRPYVNGDYVFISSFKAIGVYNDEKITIIESSYPEIVGNILDPKDYSTKKIPQGSKLSSILILFEK